MKKTILKTPLLIASLCLFLHPVHSFSPTNSNRFIDDKPDFSCGVQINSVVGFSPANSNDISFTANVTLQHGTVITEALFNITFESGARSALIGSMTSPSSVGVVTPVNCDDKVTDIFVTIFAQGASDGPFCGDGFSRTFQPAICGEGFNLF